jgi:hypothetical protein
MRNLVLTILIVFAGLPLLAQEEVHLPPAVLAAGGSSDGSSTGFYRWRLSMVHVITLSGDYSAKENDWALDDAKPDWSVSLYPNPIEEYLNVEFKVPEARDFTIKLTDISGRSLMIQKARTIVPGEIIELNMSRFSSSLYLLDITSPDQKTHKVYRIQKI